jgi:tetratricopeptide (TPR) repeat protein
MQNLDLDELLQFAHYASTHYRADDAIQYLKEALRLSPNNAHLYLLLGAEYSRVALYNRAVNSYEYATEIEPKMHIARFRKAMLFYSSGMQEHALESLEKLLELDKESAFLYFAKGLQAAVINKNEKAIELFKAGLAKETEFPEIYEEIQQLILFAQNAIDEENAMNETSDKVTDIRKPETSEESVKDTNYNRELLSSTYTMDDKP